MDPNPETRGGEVLVTVEIGQHREKIQEKDISRMKFWTSWIWSFQAAVI